MRWTWRSGNCMGVIITWSKQRDAERVIAVKQVREYDALEGGAFYNAIASQPLHCTRKLWNK